MNSAAAGDDSWVRELRNDDRSKEPMALFERIFAVLFGWSKSDYLSGAFGAVRIARMVPFSSLTSNSARTQTLAMTPHLVF
jgi:hypothetical protein